MIARACTRFGLNYVWGLINFTAGVALGTALVGFIAGLAQ